MNGFILAVNYVNPVTDVSYGRDVISWLLSMLFTPEILVGGIVTLILLIAFFRMSKIHDNIWYGQRY